jgi:TolB-like protein/tetratricopeptide (TPR) repeat protein
MPDSTLARLYARFARLHIARIAVVYLLVAWGAIQVADTVLPALHFPAWTLTAVVLAALAGFPVAVAAGLFFGGPHPADAADSPAKAPWTASMVVVTAAVVIVAGGAMAWTFAGRGPNPAAVGAADTSASSTLIARRVLVLPFEDRTADPAFQQIGNMAADWIARGAAEITGLEVVDPATSITLAADTTIAAADLPGTLARDTRSAILISGAVYVQQDSVVFQARITDGGSGRVLRPIPAIKAPRESPNPALEELRERAMGALATLLEADLPETSTLVSHVPRYDAYQEYAAGLAATDDDALRQAHLAAAFALDTTFVLARLWLARSFLGNSNTVAKADSLARLLVPRRNQLGQVDRHALEYVQATVRRDHRARLRAASAASLLAPASGWPRHAIDLALNLNRISSVMAELDRLEPSTRKPLEAAWYWETRARALHRLGRHDDALASARNGVAAAPEATWARYEEARELAALGRIDELMLLIEQMTLQPVEAPALGLNTMLLGWELAGHGHAVEAQRMYEWTLTWWESRSAEWHKDDLAIEMHADVLLELGRIAEAAAIYRGWAADPRDGTPSSRTTMLAVMAAAEGDTATAEREIERLQAHAGDSKGGDIPFNQAIIACWLGDKDRAVAYLKLAFEQGAVIYDLFHAHAGLATLRGYPPFEELIRPT